MSDEKPQQHAAPKPEEEERKIERKEDEEGIPGYGQPPSEVRTTHLQGGREYHWDERKHQK
jgi:hypothetical protein